MTKVKKAGIDWSKKDMYDGIGRPDLKSRENKMSKTKKELREEFNRAFPKTWWWSIITKNNDRHKEARNEIWSWHKAKEEEMLGRIVKFIDEVELSYRDTTLEEWKAFKHIRNGIRDRFLSSLKKGEKTK